MGPLAVDGSTTVPPCVICTSPRATMRRAARRAAWDGQVLGVAARPSRSARITASSAQSVASTWENLQGTIEFYQSRTSTELTTAAERLAVISLITLPVTVVSSVLGMNRVVKPPPGRSSSRSRCSPWC